MDLQERRAHWVVRLLPDMKPEAGDVLIGRLEQGAGAFALGVMPGGFQIAYLTYDDALTHAKRFAETIRVDVWVADGERQFALVARHRAAAPAQRPR